MADLTRDDIVGLAALARLELSEDEITEYRREVSAILAYVEQLQAVDVSGLLPTNQVTGLTNVMRSDEIIDYGYDVGDLQRNVPRIQSDLIKVNRMIG